MIHIDLYTMFKCMPPFDILDIPDRASGRLQLKRFRIENGRAGQLWRRWAKTQARSPEFWFFDEVAVGGWLGLTSGGARGDRRLADRWRRGGCGRPWIDWAWRRGPGAARPACGLGCGCLALLRLNLFLHRSAQSWSAERWAASLGCRKGHLELQHSHSLT